MSSSASNSNGILQKTNEFSIALSKLNKQNHDRFEMNSINSAILLNPTTIKVNHPVINNLYTPILNQSRQDVIDLSAISINTFANNALLANSFQSLQPNKYHPYLRNNTGTSSSCQINNSKNQRSNNGNSKSNGQLNNQSVIAFNSSSASTSSNSNSHLSQNLRLSDEFSSTASNIAQNLIKSQNAYSIDLNSSTNSSSRLINDTNLNNWLINNQLNQFNNSAQTSYSTNNLQTKNQINKRSRLVTGNKNFYSDKNAVDSVKKLDKILLNHNKNLQEIIRHKNQLIDRLNKRNNQIGNNSQINYSNNYINNHNSNRTKQLNYQQQLELLNSNNVKIINRSSHNDFSNNFIYNQLNNINQQLNQLNQIPNSKLILNNNNKRLKNETKNDNLINRNNLISNKSLSVLTKAINEEAELNKQKLEKKILENDIQQTTIKQSNQLIINKTNIINLDTTTNSINKEINESNQLSNKITTIEIENKNIISKLDQREIRLKRLREESNEDEIFYINNGDLNYYDFSDELDDCLSDIELEDEYDYRLKSMSIIFNTIKSTTKLTKTKLNYLNLIGLTTEENKQKLEFEKLIRSKRTLKEISNVDSNDTNNITTNRNQSSRSRTLRSYSTRNQSRLINEIKKDNSIDNFNEFSNNQTITKNKDNEILIEKSNSFNNDIFNEFIKSIINRKLDSNYLELSKVSPLTVRDSSNNKKLRFMNQIGLKIENDVENIKSREFFWEGILADRERRKIFEICLENLNDNLDPLTKQKWLNQLNDKNLNSNLRILKDSNGKLKTNNNLTTDLNDINKRNNLKINLINTNFEFNKLSTNLTMDKLVKNDHFDIGETTFKWPGIEKVVQSYLDYTKEIEMDKLKLSVNLSKAQEDKINKSNELSNLRKKKTDLEKTIKDLKDDELKLKNVTENLIKSLKII